MDLGSSVQGLGSTGRGGGVGVQGVEGSGFRVCGSVHSGILTGGCFSVWGKRMHRLFEGAPAAAVIHVF